MILEGDFNCIRDPADTIGHFQNSRTLAELLHGKALENTIKQNPVNPMFTHYSPSSASRIDRLYLCQELMAKEHGTEILQTAFTDHNAVVLRLAVDTPIMRRGRGCWIMKPTLKEEERIKGKIQKKWAIWKTHKRYYPDATSWWERYVKKNLDNSWARKKLNGHRLMENLYECLYGILRSNTPQEDKLPALKYYK